MDRLRARRQCKLRYRGFPSVLARIRQLQGYNQSMHARRSMRSAHLSA